MDHYYPLGFEYIFNHKVAFMKKPTCMTPIAISLTAAIIKSNLTIMIFVNHVIFKIIVPLHGFTINSTS